MKRLTRGEVSEALGMVMRGETLEAITEVVDAPMSTVSVLRDRAGLRPYYAAHVRRANQRSTARQLWDDGATVAEIGEALDRTTSTVYRILNECGIYPKERSTAKAERVERVAQMMDDDVSAAEMAEREGVTTTTIYRDMAEVLRGR